MHTKVVTVLISKIPPTKQTTVTTSDETGISQSCAFEEKVIINC